VSARMRCGAGRRSCVLVTLLAPLVAGCAPVGPKYEPPKTVPPAAYKEQTPGAEMMQPAQPSDEARRPAWWEVFGDTRLNELEAKLQASNPTLSQAEARYRQARALVRENRAQRYPTVNVGGSIDTGRPSTRQGGTIGVSSPSTTTQYSVTGDAAWELDFWGRIRQTVNASVANAQATAGDRESTRLSLSAELALDYYQLRSLDAELALLHQTIEAYQKSFTLTQNQYNAGIVARADVAQAETLLESARAQEVDTRLQRAQVEHAIAILTGDLPSSLTIDTLPLAGDPPLVPTELPSRLLERRPDIAAAERRVAAANAEIGVATAAFFPTISLNAAGGFQTTKLQQFLSWPSGFWSVGPALALTVFDGGARRAAKERAIGAYDETVGLYRQTVLSAFADVEDNLSAVHLLSEEQKRQQAAVAAAQRALDISLNQYRAGLISYLQVAITQATLLNNQRTELSVASRRYAAAVQLIRALGGGWDGKLE
jgi:NodT family efflux transporter outer membrane factor (OMF) lipoprotein